MTKYGYCTKVKDGVIPFREIADRLSAQEGYPVSVHGVKHIYWRAMRKLKVMAKRDPRFRELLRNLTGARIEQERKPVGIPRSRRMESDVLFALRDAGNGQCSKGKWKHAA